MGYKTERVEFPELFEDAYVDVVDAELMPWGAKKKLARLSHRMEEITRAQESGEGLSPEDEETLTTQATSIVAAIIVATNITPVGGTEPLRIPVAEEQLDAIPGIVVERVLSHIQAQEPGPTETIPTSAS